MTIRTSLLGGAALGALVCVAMAPAASAATHRHHVVKHVVVADTGVRDEVAELRAEVQALKAQENSDHAATQDQVQDLQVKLTSAETRASQAEAQVAEQIQTIPGVVDTEVAKAKPKTDKLYYKGITLTLGGFAAAEGVYRSKNDVADIGSNYSKIPYDNNVLAHSDELHGTARQSRISFLAQGNIDPSIQAAFYGEFDFLGAAQTANSNESDSYNLRVRNLYGTVD